MGWRLLALYRSEGQNPSCNPNSQKTSKERKSQWGPGSLASTELFVDSVVGFSARKEVVFGESHLRQVLQRHVAAHRPHSSGSCTSPRGMLEAPGCSFDLGDCEAQLDCHGDILSLNLSSSANVVALTRGVLLAFAKLRVSD